MGFERLPQFRSRNGCVYIYNQDEKRWYMICPTDVLPADVKDQIREIKEKAEMLKDCK
jgi:reverse gyrase